MKTELLRKLRKEAGKNFRYEILAEHTALLYSSVKGIYYAALSSSDIDNNMHYEKFIDMCIHNALIEILYKSHEDNNSN